MPKCQHWDTPPTLTQTQRLSNRLSFSLEPLLLCILSPTRDGHALVDLHLANRDQLIDLGVRDENIFTAPFCTIERPDLFFSYRLEKRKYGKTGRLLSVIGRR